VSNAYVEISCSSWPYPQQFLDWMRTVFKNPQPFINQCIQQGTSLGLTGFNIDWEPTATATEQDALDYANFLTTLTNALQPKGLGVSVDVATWNTIWNYTALGQSTVDPVITMVRKESARSIASGSTN